MSAIIYISSGDNDLTPEQLALLHKFSDQARCWAFLLLKEAGVIKTREEWYAKREEWLRLLQELSNLNKAYAEAVNNTLREAFQKTTSPSSTSIPSAEPFFPGKPDEAATAAELAAKIKTLFVELNPGKDDPKGKFIKLESDRPCTTPGCETAGQRHTAKQHSPEPPHECAEGTYENSCPCKEFAPKLTPGVPTINEIYFDPQYAGEVGEWLDKMEDWKKTVGINPSKMGGHGLKGMLEGMIINMTKDSYRKANEEVADRIANDVLARSIEAFNPFQYEDTGKFKGKDKKATFATYLYRALRNAVYSYTGEGKRKDAAEVSLSAPISGEEENMTFEEKLAAPDPADNVTWDEYLPVFKKWVADYQTTHPKFPQTSADRLVAIFSMLFTDRAAPYRGRWTAIAKALGMDNARLHNLFYGDHPLQSADGPWIKRFIMQQPELAEHFEKTKLKWKRAALDNFLMAISTLRKEGGLNYDLLRNKIQKKLSQESEQLFTVYSHLYESSFSNPDTARLMKLSPPRITGLKKRITASLLELPEIDNIVSEGNTTSPLRRFLYKEGDAVRVLSIGEVGTIESVWGNDWFNIVLANGNEVLTVKDDLVKHSTLVDSANSVVAHYYDREVLTPQCYLSLVAGVVPQLVILELRPSSEVKTSARLHINNNLVEITEISEKFPDNLISILKGHLGNDPQIDTPFTSLFTEYE